MIKMSEGSIAETLFSQKVVRPTISGTHQSSEAYCEWHLYKR